MALCARDFKGVGSQYFFEGKVIAQEIDKERGSNNEEKPSVSPKN